MVTTKEIHPSGVYGTTHSSPQLPSHWFVIAFGLNDLGHGHTPIGDARVHLGWPASHATELAVPDGLSADVELLVERDLLPTARQRPEHAVIRMNVFGRDVPSGAPKLLAERDAFHPFLSTADGARLAGWFLRAGGKAECWALPGDVKRHDDWVRAALRQWRERAPARFERLPGWEREPQWMTAAETVVHDQLLSLRGELEATVAAMKAEEANLESQLAEGRQAADAGLRRLLTARSDRLVDAVADALRLLGFEVVGLDEEREGSRLEDLVVTDAIDPDWVALGGEGKHRRREGQRSTDPGTLPRALPRHTRPTASSCVVRREPIAWARPVNSFPGAPQ